MFSWNILLAKYGTILFGYRKEYIEEINKYFTEIYQSIMNNKDRIDIEYTTEILNNSENDYYSKLENNYHLVLKYSLLL